MQLSCQLCPELSDTVLYIGFVIVEIRGKTSRLSNLFHKVVVMTQQS